jgi:hypothetical protein
MVVFILRSFGPAFSPVGGQQYRTPIGVMLENGDRFVPLLCFLKT